MKIEAITLREIRMPLVHFFETSFGRTTARRILLVKLHAQGVDAWGECVAGEHPYYSEESIDTAWQVITSELAPALIGKRMEKGSECAALFARVRGHRMAKAAIENALQKDRQVILFQNRRGYAPFLICGTCGFIPHCENCAVTLTLHKYSNKLHCHYCGYKEDSPSVCPACGSTHLNTKVLVPRRLKMN